VLGKVSIALLIGGVTIFGWRRLLSYLRYFQQEEYNEARFRTWLEEKGAGDTRGTAITITAALCASLLASQAWTFVIALVTVSALLFTVLWVEEDPRTSGKLPLKMTQRASKIVWCAFALFGFFNAILLYFSWISLPGGCASQCITITPWYAFTLTALFSSLLIRVVPEYLIIANKALAPAEHRLQQHYISDAKRILRDVNPYVIGITGSYGKTGAKAALGELLPQCVGPTFWPKKSINTVMGITRDIRERLKPHHAYAVIEMGAYGIGSITKLCALTPPKAAIVTAVGIMHLERFGSEENVYLAKSEIAQAVSDDGVLVCNGDNPGARRMAQQHTKATTLLYGLDPSSGHLDCYATDINFTTEGSVFTLHWKGRDLPARTLLLGKPALSNALAAFTMACALGADPSYAAACLANLQPVDNRLVLDRKGPVSFLRDAYNSNPTGFAAALELLGTITAKRRILITPGMIELGTKQHEENRRLAAIAARVADLVIVVSPVNRTAIVEGLRDGGLPSEKQIVVDTRQEAFQYLSKVQTAGDLVLIENDLGDLLEGRISF
jgi:UDP-N-acetylmuramoyl-tripeptide--D-alanyl-D-alanine ligase